MNYQVLKQAILDKTNGGLKVFLDLYPNARDVVEGHTKTFKLYPESLMPSATIQEKNGIWYMCDFGGDGIFMDCFSTYQRENHIEDIRGVLLLLAALYNVEFV